MSAAARTVNDRFEVRLEPDPATFAPSADEVVRRDPVRCSVLATVLAGALQHGAAPGSLWITVRADRQLVLAAVFTAQFGLWLTPIAGAHPDDPDDAVAAEVTGVLARVLARELAGRPHGPGADLPRVGGMPGPAGAFARAWQGLTGRRSRVAMHQRQFELTDLVEPVGVPGAARPARPGDRGLCLAWLEAFRAEAVPDQPPGDERVVDERIADGRLTLWCDGGGGPVSLAGTTPVVAGVARVGPVYTPPEQRRHGYGAAVTAAATRAGFAAGAQRCTLLTDLANPTSNALYPRLGYRPVGDAVSLTFAD